MPPEEPHFDASPQTTRLLEVLQNLEVHIKRQNSLKYSLLKGMVYGLGTVIGATILVALFGGALSYLFDISLVATPDSVSTLIE